MVVLSNTQSLKNAWKQSKEQLLLKVSRLGSNFVQAEELSEGERMLTRAAQLLRGCGASFLLEHVRVLNSVGMEFEWR